MPYKDPEVQKAWIKKWRQSPIGIKSTTLYNWKRSGLIDSDGDKYEKRYSAYLQATNCEVCKSVFKDTFDKCLDHCHQTGIFRQFLCRACNIFDYWKKKVSLS